MNPAAPVTTHCMYSPHSPLAGVFRESVWATPRRRGSAHRHSVPLRAGAEVLHQALDIHGINGLDHMIVEPGLAGTGASLVLIVAGQRHQRQSVACLPQ